MKTDDGGAGVAESMSDWPTGRLLSIAARLVEHAWLDVLASRGLTHAGLIVLDLLDEGSATQAALASRARVEAQTMSRTLDRLERDGLVARHSDPGDRRRRLVERTPLGSEIYARLHDVELDMFPQAAETPAFRDALLGIIESSSDRRWAEGET